jgi:P27 family predicted phage terminase small subunit
MFASKKRGGAREAGVKKPRAKRQAAPTGLSKAGRELWSRLVAEFGIVDAGGLAVLEQGLRSWERAEQARRQLDREGLTFRDRWGQARPNPALPVERDARAAFLSAIKQLQIEIPTAEQPGASIEGE